jgi:hypothetical protein
VDDGVGGGEVQARAAGLQRDQEHRDAAGLEGIDRLLAIGGVTGQRSVADAGASSARRSGRASRELREDEDAAPASAVDELEEHVELALLATERAASTLTRRDRSRPDGA